MNTLNKLSSKVRWLASLVATVATLCVMGGSLGLAEHYAEAGMASQTNGSAMAGQAEGSSNA